MASAGDPLEVECAGEEWCPITATATVVGRKWHPVIVHRLLDGGPLGFSALEAEIGAISSKVLSDNLETLEEYGLVDREVVSEKPFRVQYSLTDRGRSLEPLIVEMWEWGTTELAPPDDDRSRSRD